MAERLLNYFVCLKTGCWLWQGSVDKDGYGRIRGSTNGKIEVIRVPRASWQFYRGTIPKGFMVLHDCDTPACMNPSHLYLGKQRENGLDKKVRKRARTKPLYGQDNPMSATNREKRKIER